MKVQHEVVGVETAQVPRAGWGLALARGVYYHPADRRPQIAFIATHFELDFSQHYLADLLAARGYGFLGWNTRFCGHPAHFLLDRALIDIGLGVVWLREHGAKVVVLLGNSGGGPLLAAYQAQARRPVVRAAEGLRLSAGLDSLPGADLYISLAAHPGRAEVLTHWLDPASSNEQDPLATDPSLDMYDPENGPPYARSFIDHYRSAQRERNQRISEWCFTELERLAAGGYPDRLFTVARTWADLRFTDGSLDPSARPTPACYRGDPARANRGIDGIGMLSSLRTWLAMWSLEHSQCDPGEALGLIELPALVIQAEADSGVFPSDARSIFDRLGSNDKRLAELPGDHYFRWHGRDSSPADSREDVADLIAEWVAERA